MFETEEKKRKYIITPDGEDEFRIRYISDENVGLLTSRSERSYFILDSIDYWYDCIQDRYPPIKKCRCKNDFFKLYFDFIPRIGTDDYRSVELISCCTECGELKKFAAVDIDYSPAAQLYDKPIAYCEKPKIKYKTYSLEGYWHDEAFYDLTEFLSQQQLLIYCYYWDKGKRLVNRFSPKELRRFLFEEKNRYLNIYFSAKPLEVLFDKQLSDNNGIYIDADIWRKEEIVKLHSPLTVAGIGQFYKMDLCGEYIESGQVKSKSEEFCKLTQKIYEYGKKSLKNVLNK